MAVVYQHRRKDTNEVFYIGIGKYRKRAFNKIDRSIYWKRIVNKYGYSVDVLVDGCSAEEAQKIEIGLINSYGRSDLGLGSLINKTDGGDGGCGLLVSEETKLKISKSKKGKKQSDESNKKRSETLKGRKHSDESNRKRSNTLIGHKHSEDTKLKISKACKGKIPKPISEETRNKFYEISINRGTLICPHCNKEKGVPAIYRWHFDNCKNKI